MMQHSIDANAQSSVVTHSRNGCGCLNTKDWLKLASNLAIPLIIGVFTIFISINQQNTVQINRDKDVAQAAELRRNDTERAQKQREEDKEIARLQREEDKKFAQLQREEDQRMSRLQREEDREIARQQRADDKENARLQREVDLKIARDKRIQEYELTEKEHSLYQSQRAHEVEIAQQNYMANLILKDDRRKENILINYQRQLAKLLLHYGFQLNISQSTLLFVLRMRTRAAFRLLNPVRRSVLMHTLRQGGLFNELWKAEKSLLYRINASGVQFGLPTDYSFSRYLTGYNYLDIERADLRYASFHSVSIDNEPSFAYSNLDYTDWSYGEVSFVNATD
ncbi:unnamed protein product [Adineta steineri]|uniref:Uncharacterized protein n=1 Tax=Adineta steineri TaxID=433720 RepID=A0A815C702_9BILA|nr:unnamed protein product [Adineta steineri]CAF3958200.1 unnamed protein product [Adineta steineri]